MAIEQDEGAIYCSNKELNDVSFFNEERIIDNFLQSIVWLIIQLFWSINTWDWQHSLIFFSWWDSFVIDWTEKRPFDNIIWECFNCTNETFSSPSVKCHSFYSVDKYIFNYSHSCTIHHINVSMNCSPFYFIFFIWKYWIGNNNKIIIKSRMISKFFSELSNESIAFP